MSNDLQKQLRHMEPERAAAVEAESRLWMVICPRCGFERSVWDAGGIRYKAAGMSRLRMTCPNCDKVGWNKVVWRGPPGTSGGASPGFILKLVLGIVVGVALAVAAILLLVFRLTGRI